MKKFVIGLLTGVFLMIVFVSGAVTDRRWGIPYLDQLAGADPEGTISLNQRILTEENVVTEVAERVSPAVVTVSTTHEFRVSDPFFMDPFGYFRQPGNGRVETEQVDIGSGFIVDPDGLIVTNKHVVASGNAEKFKVILKDGSERQVSNIWRDPTNDLAILKIDGGGLQAIEQGDSGSLKVGNFVIAIGTALGEFRHTVTTGVISGLGRGITAGDGLAFAEQLENVIQTDAAINPGNSGGPLLNSAGQVIGVNVAVSQGANNIGFALPINLVKDSLRTFNETGQFNRAFFGVRYQLIPKETAIMNNVPEGALVREVLAGSSAEAAGIVPGDILISFDGRKIADEENGLAALVSGKRIGDRVDVEYFRDGNTAKVTVELKGE